MKKQYGLKRGREMSYFTQKPKEKTVDLEKAVMGIFNLR